MDITQLCAAFMKDKYGITVEDAKMKRMCAVAMKQVEDSIGNQTLPTIEIQKRAISIVKAKLLKEQKPIPEQPVIQPPSAPLPPIAEQDDSKHDETEDFAQRLQELEMTRNAALAASMIKPPSDPVKPGVDTKAVERVAAVNAPMPTVVYIPSGSTKFAKSKPIIINGIDRMWNYFHERSVVVWSGPLPTFAESFTMSLNSLTLPPTISTPYVIVDITSATGVQVLIPCFKVFSSHPWDVWKPVSQNVATFTPFACPWTIKLLDCRQQPLDLGKDGEIVDTVSKLLNGCTKITLKSKTTGGLKPGHRIITGTGKKQTSKTVMHVLNNEIEIEGDVLPGQIICNESAQMSLLFEAQKNDSTVSSTAKPT